MRKTLKFGIAMALVVSSALLYRRLAVGGTNTPATNIDDTAGG